MTQFFYDFSEYSTGDIVTVGGGDWATQGTLTSWTRQVVSDAGATGGKTLVIQDDNQDWGDQMSFVVNDEAGATTTDIEVVARWKLATIANHVPGDRVMGPVLVAASNACYGVRLESTTSIRGTEFNSSGAANDNIGLSLTVSTIGAGYVWTRIGRSGSTIRLKFWRDDESEPADWQRSATNTVLSSIKAAAGAYDYNAGPYTFDVIGIGTGGDAAPTSGGAPAVGHPVRRRFAYMPGVRGV